MLPVNTQLNEALFIPSGCMPHTYIGSCVKCQIKQSSSRDYMELPTSMPGLIDVSAIQFNRHHIRFNYCPFTESFVLTMFLDNKTPLKLFMVLCFDTPHIQVSSKK